MKRLILLSIILILNLLHADTILQGSVANQSSLEQDDISVSISNVHHINLDNTDIYSGGNWLNKRIWYERSQKVFDEIRVLVSAITDLRIQFTNEVNAVGQKIDIFFEAIHFTQGELDDKFKEIITSLDVKQKIVGDLTEQERTLQASVKQNLPAIDQIEKDIKSIGEIDKKIDQVSMQSSKTIDECRDLETKSWDAFKAIAKELDDKKARNLYYQINNYKENIDQKNNYLKSTLLPYLHNVLVAKIEKNINAINSSVEALKTKGLDLEKIMERNQEDDAIELKHREKQEIDIAVKKAIEDEVEKAKLVADKAAKDLEEANEKSFSNVVHNYYQATIGKCIHMITPMYTFIAQLSITGYLYDGMMYGKNQIHLFFSYITSYVHYFLKIKSVKTKDIADNNNKAIEVKVADVVDLNEKKELLPVIMQAPQESLDATNSQVDASASIESKDVPKDSSNQEVVVQSLHMNQTDQLKDRSIDLHQICTDVFNLIHTLLLSLYNCLIQLFRLVYNFSLYIAS